MDPDRDYDRGFSRGRIRAAQHLCVEGVIHEIRIEHPGPYDLGYQHGWNEVARDHQGEE